MGRVRILVSIVCALAAVGDAWGQGPAAPGAKMKETWSGGEYFHFNFDEGGSPLAGGQIVSFTFERDASGRVSGLAWVGRLGFATLEKATRYNFDLALGLALGNTNYGTVFVGGQVGYRPWDFGTSELKWKSKLAYAVRLDGQWSISDKAKVVVGFAMDWQDVEITSDPYGPNKQTKTVEFNGTTLGGGFLFSW